VTNRANTISFAEMLNKLSIAPGVEIDITTDQQPGAVDVYPVLLAARRLVEHGIAIDEITVIDGSVEVVVHIPLSDYKGGWLKIALMFDKEFSLANASAEVDINHPDELVHVYDGIDIGMFIPISTLLTYLANHIYTMMFDYVFINDVLATLEMNYVAPTFNRAICINGLAYAQLPKNELSVIDPETGIIDLILVQAFNLTSQHPEVGNLDLVVDVENATLCFASE
jgi:hypothetical protein